MSRRIVICGRHRAALTQRLVCQLSTLGMPVRFRRAAPSAASIKVMHQALTLGNGDQYPGGALCGCDENLAHLAGSNPAVWEFESPHPHSMPGRLTAGLLTLDQAIEVRILAGAAHAAAHGCGTAFVRRMARVGTGWRLHVLVAQFGRRRSAEVADSAVRLPPRTPSTGASTETACWSVKRKRP